MSLRIRWWIKRILCRHEYEVEILPVWKLGNSPPALTESYTKESLLITRVLPPDGSMPAIVCPKCETIFAILINGRWRKWQQNSDLIPEDTHNEPSS